MADNEQEIHRECVNRMIALANTLKDEGVSVNVVSASLMTASGLYASYIVGGNEGGLTESGVQKVSEVYKSELTRLQDIKRGQEAG